jgi:DNA-binding transcriptional LysR family regulator
LVQRHTREVCSMRMELRHLRYFVAVAEELNITRAAVRLHVAQPPLSRQIRDLERELGVSLFERNTKGVSLTPAGETLLVEAQSILGHAEEAVERVKEVALGRRGKVRIGHAPAASEILRSVLRSFSRTHAQVGLDLREMTTNEMLRGLRDHTLDVALTVLIAERDFEGLIVELVAIYPLCVAASSKHRFARLREVPMSEFAREPILGRSRREYPEAHDAQLKILAPYTRSPNIIEEYDRFASLIAAVEAGRGVALVAHLQSRASGKNLVLRPLKPAPPHLAVAIAYRVEGVSTVAAAFIAATRAVRLKQPRTASPILAM